jgi:hypothetical protein
MSDEWIKKMWYICTMEYYWIIKRNKNYAGEWMKLKIIMLSDVSEAQKDKGHMFSSYVEAIPKR